MSPYLPPFCQQLLSNTKWTSVCLDLLSLLPLPPAVAVDAWQVLLMAAVQLQGDEFMTGGRGVKVEWGLWDVARGDGQGTSNTGCFL